MRSQISLCPATQYERLPPNEIEALELYGDLEQNKLLRSLKTNA